MRGHNGPPDWVDGGVELSRWGIGQVPPSEKTWPQNRHARRSAGSWRNGSKPAYKLLMQLVDEWIALSIEVAKIDLFATRTRRKPRQM